MDRQSIEQVRSFNRTMTECIGVLNDHFLGRNHPLGEARLLWEIGKEGSKIRELRRRLQLDSAYVSRLLRSLEKQGWVVIRTSKNDGRVRNVQLTGQGMRERTELDRRADNFALSLLEPLNESQRRELVASMSKVEQLVTTSMVQIRIADPISRNAKWCIDQYLSELDGRLETGFDPARSTSANADELTPPAGLLLVAYLREEPIGCGALKFHGKRVGELKRMWVAPRVRGLGLGRRLLSELEHAAIGAGIKILRLETHHALIEAIDMYRHSGYREVRRFSDDPYADNWFEKRL